MTAILAVLLGGMAANTVYGDIADSYWPTWRGPNADGVAVQGNPPLTWSETKNIKWKVALPGSGDSTPVVWEDKIFVTTAVALGEEAPASSPPQGRRRGHGIRQLTVPYKFSLICLDRQTGKVLWDETVREEVPHEGHHPSSGLASYSAITDGEHVWVSFGSRGLHCYDLDGNHVWSANLIEMRARNSFGEGSSPALAGEAVIVVADHEGDSKIFACNKNTGKLLWETDRDEHTSWATPLPVQVGDTLQVITSATGFIRSYDAMTGELIWQCGGQTLNAIPSPVVGFGNVYCTSGYRGAALQAIKLGRTGDLSGSDAIVWEVNKDTPYVSSPLLYDDRIYVTRGLGGDISCYQASTGKPLFERQKLEGIRQIYSSPVGAGGRVYITGRKGTTKVIKHSNSFEVLATNVLDDGFDASPVVIGDEMYLKGETYLYCIAEQ